jgi:hypothetical protein
MVNFVLKHYKEWYEDKSKFKYWFRFHSGNGAVCIDSIRDPICLSGYWMFDGYIPHYVGGKYIGYGSVASVVTKHEPVVPFFKKGFPIENMVILEDVYDGQKHSAKV